ncbi:MAG TPA: MFS transporter [Nitrososphaerales archaeon]|nr:MFS transporter [Nitrososphaerales archaeon]
MQYKWTVLTVTTVGVLMSGVDGRIVVIGLPTVAAYLHADAEQAIWFTQAYTIGSTVALLFIGRVSDIVGRVKVYTLGFTVFTLGSLLTSVSFSPDTFIAARIFQGLGSAALFANSAAIITDSFPTTELGRALGINSVAFRAGSMLGLTLSGVILTVADWRFLFYINIPVGIFGTLWARRRLHEIGQRQTGSPMDWPGFAIFTVFISSFLLMLTFAAYGIGESNIVALLGIIAAISISAFVKVERGKTYPLLDFSLLRIREFAGGVTAQLLNAMAWGSFILTVSLYLQLVKGLAPIQAGVFILPFDIAFLLVGPASGRLSDKFGTLPFVTAGLALISASLLLFSTVTATTSFPTLVLYLTIGGAGMGLFVSPNISSIMGSVPPNIRGVASGLRATFFNVGFTISFNITILVLSLYIPYSFASAIISSAAGAPASIADRAMLSTGLDGVYRVLAVINTLAIVPSLLRGRRIPNGAGAAPDSDSNIGAQGSLPVD